MDSVTQFVLGAGVSCALLGRRIGLRKAAITGGVLGTIPDLDVFLPTKDAVEAFISHRGWSHSLIIHALLAPFIGEGLHRLFKSQHATRAPIYAAVFLILSTHALLDAMTVYGTKLFWPVWNEPVGLGAVFIIDPLYTLPLLTITLWALIHGQWSQTYAKGLVVALGLSTTYLVWSVAGQAIAENRSKAYLAEIDIHPTDILTTPTPFNTLYWRSIALDDDVYYNIYVPLAGSGQAITAYKHERKINDLSCWLDEELSKNNTFRSLARFSKGFFKIYEAGQQVRYADLRMGVTPNYAFTFDLAKREQGYASIIAPRRVELERASGNDWDWLMSGLLGEAIVRQAEANSLVNASTKLSERHQNKNNNRCS